MAIGLADRLMNLFAACILCETNIRFFYFNHPASSCLGGSKVERLKTLLERRTQTSDRCSFIFVKNTN